MYSPTIGGGCLTCTAPCSGEPRRARGLGGLPGSEGPPWPVRRGCRCEDSGDGISGGQPGGLHPGSGWISPSVGYTPMIPIDHERGMIQMVLRICHDTDSISPDGALMPVIGISRHSGLPDVA